MHKRKNKRLILRILPILLVSSLCLTLLGGCSRVKKAENPSADSRFVSVERTATWRIVYDKNTKVMYAVSCGYYNCGTFTLLVDAEGNPLLWSGT